MHICIYRDNWEDPGRETRMFDEKPYEFANVKRKKEKIEECQGD